jgi:hypothetical protein
MAIFGTTAITVAEGMISVGLRDSSPYMAADSKPIQKQKAKNSPMPTAPATAIVAPGFADEAGREKPKISIKDASNTRVSECGQRTCRLAR